MIRFLFVVLIFVLLSVGLSPTKEITMAIASPWNTYSPNLKALPTAQTPFNAWTPTDPNWTGPQNAPPPPPAPSYSAPAPAASQTPGWAQPWEAMGLSPEYMMRWGGAANQGGDQGGDQGGNGGQPQPQQPQYLAFPPGMGATPGIAPQIPNPLAPNPNTINPLPPGYTSLDVPEELYSFVPEPLRQGFGSAINSFLQRLGYSGQGNVGRYGERSYAFPAGTSQPYFSPDMFGYISDPYIRQLIQYLFGERGQATRIPLPTAPAMA